MADHLPCCRPPETFTHPGGWQSLGWPRCAPGCPVVEERRRLMYDPIANARAALALYRRRTPRL